MKNLEDYFEQNYKQFNDQEPEFGHFNRFANRLEQAHHKQNIKPKKAYQNVFIQRIAFGLLFIVATTVAIQKSNSKSNSIQNSQPTITQINNQLDEVNVQLKENREQAVSQNFAANYSESYSIEQKTTDKFTELEMEYILLKNNYQNNPCKSNLEELKTNLNTRLNLLNHVMNYQDENTIEPVRISNPDFLLTKATDCFGIPEEFPDQEGTKQLQFYALAK